VPKTRRGKSALQGGYSAGIDSTHTHTDYIAFTFTHGAGAPLVASSPLNLNGQALQRTAHCSVYPGKQALTWHFFYLACAYTPGIDEHGPRLKLVLFGARRWARARAGGRGRGGAQSAARRGARSIGVGEGAAACRSTTLRHVFFGACRRGRRLGGLSSLQVHSPVSWRCLPRRVSAWAKAWWPVALSTSGGLGRYWSAQWHLARAVGKRFRGCRAKRLYVGSVSIKR